MKNIFLLLLLTLLTSCSFLQQGAKNGQQNTTLNSFGPHADKKQPTPVTNNQIPEKPEKRLRFKIISFSQQFVDLEKNTEISKENIDFYSKIMQQSLENKPLGQKISWQTQDKAVKGIVQINNSFEVSGSKQYCREFTLKIIISSREYAAQAVACRTAERVWEVIKTI